MHRVLVVERLEADPHVELLVAFLYAMISYYGFLQGYYQKLSDARPFNPV